MSAEANKNVVLSFLENMSASKFDAALALMADSATVWIAGKPDETALARTMTKAQFAERLQWLVGAMPTGLRITPKGLVEVLPTAKPDLGRPTALGMDGASNLLIADQGKLYRLRLADRSMQPVREAVGVNVTAFAWDRFGRLYLAGAEGVAVLPRPGTKAVSLPTNVVYASKFTSSGPKTFS